MIEITYDPVHGEPVADGQLENEWAYIHSHKDHNVRLCYGTENIISRVRLAVANDEISCFDVVLVYQNQAIALNKYGTMFNCPTGFCDTLINLSEAILMSGFRKAKVK